MELNRIPAEPLQINTMPEPPKEKEPESLFKSEEKQLAWELVNKIMSLYDNKKIPTVEQAYPKMKNLYRSVFLAQVIAYIDSLSTITTLHGFDEIVSSALENTNVIMSGVNGIQNSIDYYSLMENNHISQLLLNKIVYEYVLDDLSFAVNKYLYNNPELFALDPTINNDLSYNVNPTEYICSKMNELFKKDLSGTYRIIRVKEILEKHVGAFSGSYIDDGEKSCNFKKLGLNLDDIKSLIYFEQAGENARIALNMIECPLMIPSIATEEYSICSFTDLIYPFFNSKFSITDDDWINQIAEYIQYPWEIENDFLSEKDYIIGFLFGIYHHIKTEDVIYVSSQRRKQLLQSIYNMQSRAIPETKLEKNAVPTSKPITVTKYIEQSIDKILNWGQRRIDPEFSENRPGSAAYSILGFIVFILIFNSIYFVLVFNNIIPATE
ncbi:hypothetical protein NEIG_00661 [Nematocida sp. ERTm5]|nr:hypothetical protein NEIG_00661 [Nematocida sp. ERTm5]